MDIVQNQKYNIDLNLFLVFVPQPGNNDLAEYL